MPETELISREVWHFAKADWDKLRDDLSEADWSFLATASPSDGATRMTEIIMDTAAACIPRKTLTERNITENSGLAVGQDDKAKVFQCGVHAMDRWYAENSDSFEYDYFGNIVPAIVNFYIATNAKIFVGVQGSSWSSDVWDTRYNQGKGKGNYEYTKKGIVPLPANRPPPPHQSCKKINERIQKRGW